jgi:hypothetical protein
MEKNVLTLYDVLEKIVIVCYISTAYSINTTTIMSFIPDHPTVGRWCKGCKDFRPVIDFSATRRSFECRAHASASQKARRTKSFASNPIKNEVWHMWQNVYADSRSVFSKEGWCLAQYDIQVLCERNNVEPSGRLRLVPICPEKPITKDNVLIVSRASRTLLTKVWKISRDRALYLLTLEKQKVKEG